MLVTAESVRQSWNDPGYSVIEVPGYAVDENGPPRAESHHPWPNRWKMHYVRFVLPLLKGLLRAYSDSLCLNKAHRI